MTRLLAWADNLSDKQYKQRRRERKKAGLAAESLLAAGPGGDIQGPPDVRIVVLYPVHQDCCLFHPNVMPFV